MQYNFKGAYDATQSYAISDVVSYVINGVTKYYYCLSPNNNTSPQYPMNVDSSFWSIINALSNFPNSVDSFQFRSDISANDKVDIARINTLTLQATLSTDEQNELSGLIAKYRNKLFLADDLNAIQNSISNLQMYYKDKVDSKLTQNLTDINTETTNGLGQIDTKLASVNTYLDSTTAGALRVDLGVMGNLTTTDKSSLVNAVNEVKSKQGDLTTLTSTNKNDLVSSLNETRANAQMFKLTQDNGNIKTTTEPNLTNITTAGMYYIGSAQTTSLPPSVTFGILTVSRNGAEIYQTIMQIGSALNGRQYFRQYTGSAWTTWNQSLIADFNSIPADLNLMIISGYYYCNPSTLNAPSTNAGNLIVCNIDNSNTNYSQTFTDFSTGYQYYRVKYSGVWQPWSRILTANETQTSLWTGAAYPAAVTTITPTKTLSNCKNGWVLVWSDYVAGVGSNDYDFFYSYVPKYTSAGGTVPNGASHLYTIATSLNSTKSDYANKRLYI